MKVKIKISNGLIPLNYKNIINKHKYKDWKWKQIYWSNVEHTFFRIKNQLNGTINFN